MLTEAEKQIIIDTLMPFEPTYIGIFGSVARGEDTPESDVDIISKFNAPRMTLLDLIGIQQDLEDYFKRPVDVVSENGAKDWFLEEIQPDLKIIYGQASFAKAA